jgi:hypothetical protein
MRTIILIAAGTLCFAMTGCSTAADAPAFGTAGAAAGAGAPATAGSSSTGGSESAPSTAGANSAGAGGPAGGAATAGASGSSSSAGASSAGASSGGEPSAGTGGASGGTSAAAAGAATGGGAAGGETTIDPASVVGSWDGALVTYPCAPGSKDNYDCSNAPCSNNENTTTNTWKMNGSADTVYDVTFRVRGVVEVINYLEGMRDSGNASIVNNKDLFYRGGRALKAGETGVDYNQYKLTIAPAAPSDTAKGVYFLNSVDASQSPKASKITEHLTFPIDYSKTILVPGGSTVTLSVYDSNCRLVQNCGTTAGSNTCSAPVVANLSPATPPAPSTFQAGGTAYYQNGGHGQFVFFDVTKVAVHQ